MKKYVIILLLITFCNYSFAQKKSYFQVFSSNDTLTEFKDTLSIKIDSTLNIYNLSTHKAVINSKIHYIGTNENSKYYLDDFNNKIQITYGKNFLYSITIANPNITTLFIIYASSGIK